jgi:uncharacterized protein DUF1360
VPIWLTVPLIILTVHRVTRLVVEDTFPPIGVPRERLLNWLAPDHEFAHRYALSYNRDPRPHLGALGRSLRYLLSCPWCMSVWVGAGIIYAVTRYTSVPLPVLVWAAASSVTGLLATYEDSHSDK